MHTAGIAAHATTEIGVGNLRRYRADIDGLRAVAVVPVVLFHAGVPLFSGGYIGVDIFFVISGYLITGILLSDFERDAFSIIEFYERRIKRIFPALLLVLTASTLLALFVFTPERLVNFGQSLTSVSVFSSNFYFWKSVDYFATNAHVQPLLHTWSLAVEEQFYIFYPLLLWLVLRARMPLQLVLLVGGALSLALACTLLARMPGAVFYLLPFRAWELIVGGILATGWPSPPSGRRTSTVAALIGLAMLAAPMALYRPETPFPGLAAIPPAIGAALLIWSGTNLQSPLHAWLSKPQTVLIGRASYSFYLWHFPIFAFATYLLNRPLDPATGVTLSATALAIALASWRWVEVPARKASSRFAALLPLALMVVAGGAGLLLARSAGFPQRLSPQAALLADAASDKARHPLACMSNGDVIVPPERACRLGAHDVEPVALLWGDSHAMVTATAMQSAALQAASAFLFAAAADCPPGLGFKISRAHQTSLTSTPSYAFCGEYNQRMFKLAASNPRLHTVVISARWSNWRIGEPGNPVESPVDIRLEDSKGTASSAADNARIFEAGLTQLVKALQRAGKRVYVVGPLPEPAFDVPQALFVAEYGLFPEPGPISVAEFERRHRHALAILNRVAREQEVRMVWPHHRLCEAGDCQIVVGGVPVYFDHNHLSVAGAKMTADLYSEIFARR